MERGGGESIIDVEGMSEEASKDMQMRQTHLDEMMGGAFQLTWQEKLLEEIPIPSFLVSSRNTI